MGNNKRVLSLLMAVLGSVSSSMAAKKRPSGGSASDAIQGRRLNNGRRRNNRGSKPVVKKLGHRKLVEKQVVLNDGGTERSNKKWSNGKIAGVASLSSAAVLGAGGTVAYQYHYSDSQIRKRNLEKSEKFKTLSEVPQTSFSLLPAYEMKCDTSSGKGNLKTRPFVWLKHGGKWYVLMRKDNKTVKGALKGLGNLFKKQQELSDNGTQTPPQYVAKVSREAFGMGVVASTAGKMAEESTSNIAKEVKKYNKHLEIFNRVLYELGGPEEKKKKEQINDNITF